MHADIRYDRRVDPDFLRHFEPGGVAHSLAQFARTALFPLDLQMRKAPNGGGQHATLYVGLTAVLNVLRTKDGFRLRAHPTWANTRYGFHKDWSVSADEETWRSRWTDVERYLERVVPDAVRSHGLTEGAVQSAVSSYAGSKRVMLDREVTPAFRDSPFKSETLAKCREPILDVLRGLELGIPLPKSLGAECDLLALDTSGELFAVEVKPFKGAGIPWVPAQAAMYARVLQAWLDADDTPGDGPREVLQGMLEQRKRLGLVTGFDATVAQSPRVTPLVALQRGASKTSLERMDKVRDALDAADLGIPPMKVYEVSLTGELIER